MGKCALCSFLLERRCCQDSIGGKVVGVEPRPTLSLFCHTLYGQHASCFNWQHPL